MSWVEDTIAAFGDTIGIPGLALDEDRTIELALEGGATLVGIRHLADQPLPEVLLYQSQAVRHGAATHARRALRMADFRQPRTWPTQAGMRDDRLVLAMRIPQRAFTLDVLERAFLELGRLRAGLAD